MNLHVTELSKKLGWGRALGALDVMSKNLEVSVEVTDLILNRSLCLQ